MQQTLGFKNIGNPLVDNPLQPFSEAGGQTNRAVRLDFLCGFILLEQRDNFARSPVLRHKGGQKRSVEQGENEVLHGWGELFQQPGVNEVRTCCFGAVHIVERCLHFFMTD